ncbi:MAG: cobalamin biosynthesis protein CbiD [Deltaproteobacteria bacterium RIFCSPLOWO2_02_FULL_53_8]|nr:MAG: cobalamin biosynthesis protein CbiD [Deltaproteobacteria bacterium RIFCSPLOWO2_02_FULL_53_8]
MGKKGGLRRGFTTGAAATAGAKAASLALFASIGKNAKKPLEVTSVCITLPTKAVLNIPVKSVVVTDRTATAVIVKDAGDDPDVTNGADIVTTVEFVQMNKQRASVRIRGGDGVGVVTRPGLKIGVNRPAINPVPLGMIKSAVFEAAGQSGITPAVVVTVSVPQGRLLAEKTLNPRLGIVGGISILGTTGIVEPMSLSAYKNSIICAVDVAIAAGCVETVYSTGRTSEKAAMAALTLPEVAFVLTGDHMGFALMDAGPRRSLKAVTVAAQFGKMTKLAAGSFETHCSESSVEFDLLAKVCRALGGPDEVLREILTANTARQVFFLLRDKGYDAVITRVCALARSNAERIVKKDRGGQAIDVRVMLVGYSNEIVCLLTGC